ncbi:MAG TPA: lamin tail domain-containing protein [Pyrinomonadaceae bacterium]
MRNIFRLCGAVSAALLCLTATAPRASAQESLPGGKKKKAAVPARDGRAASPQVVPARPLIISEFRLNGTNGQNDEFIEIYNASDAPHTVQATDMSAGYGVAASDGVLRFTILNNTVIPARGHYLGCNSVAYSLSALPSGNDGASATVATCDATYTANIPNGEDPDGAGPNPPLPRRGIALFSSATAFNATTKLDAVGPTEEADALYKEGTGVRNLSPLSTPHSYVRRLPGGCIGTDPSTVDANCTSQAAVVSTAAPSSVHPQDTDNNRDDFIFVDAQGATLNTEGGTQRRLGAPGPQNSTSPIDRTRNFPASLVFPCESQHSPPNTVRALPGPTPPVNQSQGTFEIRRKFTNKTGGNVSRLRFRVVDISTFPAGTYVLPMGATCGDPGTQCAADLRPLTSTDVVEPNPAGCGGGTITVRGTTLEQAAAAEAQSSGGGYNSTLSAGTVTLGTQLANGASIDVRFFFGVQQRGAYRFFVVVEALP